LSFPEKTETATYTLEKENKTMQIGTKGEQKLEVTADKLANKVGSGLVSVFATPMMIAAIENTAASSVQSQLDEGKTTVGTLVNVSHVAATPEGMTVRVETELTEVTPNGKLLTFKVAAYDDAGLIGEGTHQRAVVDKERFEAKAQAKKS
jgi:predicted thioesterase